MVLHFVRAPVHDICIYQKPLAGALRYSTVQYSTALLNLNPPLFFTVVCSLLISYLIIKYCSSNCFFLLFSLSPLLLNPYPHPYPSLYPFPYLYPSPYLLFQAIPAEILRGTTFAVFWAGSTYFVYTVAPKGLTATMVRTVLYCTVLYCTVLYCTVLYCTALYCTVLHCTVLYCTARTQ